MKLYFVIKDGKCPWTGYETFDDARDFANFILYVKWANAEIHDIQIKQLEADENGICRDYQGNN